MYKVIVCAIEAGKEGKEILSKALEVSKTHNAKLFVTSIIPYTLLPRNYQKELKEKTIPKIESITGAFDIPKKNIIIKFGKPYEEICALAEKKSADLIIVGTHSKKGISALIGSTANGVANYAQCDVTLVRI